MNFRHQILRNDLATHETKVPIRPLKILISGSHGLVGSALVPFLTTGRHQVTRLVRTETALPNERSWRPGAKGLDSDLLEGFDAVIHLAGENIGDGRWTRQKKERIRDSRVLGTKELCRALAQCRRPPRTFLCASAVGIYGDRGSEVLHDHSSPGNDFLSGVCRDWESAARIHSSEQTRVVNLRFGVILSPAGGALKKMLTPFRLGLGGVIGLGNQFMSWITLDDALGAIHHALSSQWLAGAVNVAAPSPVTNRTFTKTLGRVLGRPTFLPMPALAARLAFGEMAGALLLASQRALPGKLEESGYRFKFPDLESGLRHVLGRAAETDGLRKSIPLAAPKEQIIVSV